MTLAVVDLAALDLARLDAAARTTGAFYLAGHGLDLDRALALARAFFALPVGEKRALGLDRSPAFRGWSEMHGARDCREQVHFGCERPTTPGQPWQALEGPNQWPGRLGAAWRAELLALQAGLASAGQRLLAAAAGILGLSLPESGDPYLLLKLIAYPASDRVGVAPHCDFSWLTLVVQDSPGLSVRDAAGAWHDAPPRPDLLFVDLGELLEWATRGRWRAAPHRVDNRSGQSRLSLPLFVNPPLSWTIEGAGSPRNDAEHVHRVLPPGAEGGRLHFGEAEWRRKSLGHWCYSADCCG
jgi:isopenicillin N synthase-like dioxygenase